VYTKQKSSAKEEELKREAKDLRKKMRRQSTQGRDQALDVRA
jgi:hypothetical protein